jgi:hypothetical protein
MVRFRARRQRQVSTGSMNSAFSDMDRTNSSGSLSSLAASGSGDSLDESPRQNLSRSLRTTKRRLLLKHVQNGSSSSLVPDVYSNDNNATANPEAGAGDSLRDISRSLRTTKRQLLLQHVNEDAAVGAAAGGSNTRPMSLSNRRRNSQSDHTVDDDFVRSMLQQRLFAA